ncbi:integrase [Camelimonas fluminis]|uniref:Tyrosine-type recombinase/integrase n=1 Tax=Camelimonas fluminis TaxID=1576911 RepID=A0ABV7UJ84_9HYPH|nr:tyrosine-type recombinase/integrase [Camelimonas fluminis]GHE62565.1 integrase [Camelimonas fluminis]
MSDEYPYVSSYKDRHGKERWRFRHGGKSASLPGAPGSPEFEEAYAAALEGRKIEKPSPAIKHPGAVTPKTLKDAWKRVPGSLPEWRRLNPETQRRQARIADGFLMSKVAEGADLVWGDVPVADLRRRHLKAIISDMSDRPHAARHLVVVIRRMILVAMDEEWIDIDPSYNLKYRPGYGGWKAWPESARTKFEARWPIGTTPRLAYALALWLGNRRTDIATLKPDAIDGDRMILKQGKTGRDLVLDITPMLREVLDATDLSGPTILRTAYGKPFSHKSLTGRMADWTKLAGLAPGHTLHGLRKTLGKMLAEGGATTRQIMDTLGHTDINHAELYTREAEQALLARDGMKAVVKLVSGGRKGSG